MSVRNACARAQGVRTGMSLSAATALVPDLIYRPRDPQIETAALEQLATWAGQFTSAVSLQPPNGLVLEIEGSLNLFGGIRRIIAAVKRGCAEMGHAVSLACAPTISAAWLLARAHTEKIIVGKIAIRDALSPLPIAALDCDARRLDAFASIGIQLVGELLALPRDGVAQRFGQPILDQLDRALGVMPEARTFFTVPARFQSSLEFPAPVSNAEALLFATKRLLTQLAGFLAARSGGIERFTVIQLHEDVAPTEIQVHLATPTRELDRFVILMRERFASTALAAPVQGIRIEANEILALAGSVPSLFPETIKESGDCHRLIERLQARLGPDAVQGLSPSAEYRPELSWLTTQPGARAKGDQALPRPLWLLEVPELLREVGSKPHYRNEPLMVIAGPEIIESGWWNGDIKRDYFVAQTPAQSTYWIFRDRRQPCAWYLHGIFG